MPVLMISSLTQKGADATIKALELGAVDYIPKMAHDEFDIKNLKSELLRKVKIVAKARKYACKYFIRFTSGEFFHMASIAIIRSRR